MFVRLKVQDFLYGRLYCIPWFCAHAQYVHTSPTPYRMSQCGMNSYLYAPKDDDKHRAYWRDLYSLEEADQLSQLAQEASARGINFIYAISPGLDITFSSSKEVALLKRKLDQVLCQYQSVL